MQDKKKQLESIINNSNSSDNVAIDIPVSVDNQQPQTTENKGFFPKVGSYLKRFVSLDNVDPVLETGNQGSVGYYNYTGNQGDVWYKKDI